MVSYEAADGGLMDSKARTHGWECPRKAGATFLDRGMESVEAGCGVKI
jgi:hypothetical protein